MASSSIPVFVESVKIGEDIFYDGGVRDNIGSSWAMENIEGIKQNVSIYSRPSNYDISDLNWKPRNVYSVLERAMDIMNMEISKNDEINEVKIAKEKKIKNSQIFMPKMLASSMYQLNPEELKKWYEMGAEAAKNQF